MKSYILSKFEAGEVKTENGAVGWKMDDGEFRPLMKDALEELFEAGYITSATVQITNNARDLYEEEMLMEYIMGQANRSEEQIAEERAEARAAFGPGQTISNMLTGETYVS